MAKIPRIEQGDRPSATFTPTTDTSLVNMAESLGGVSDSLLDVATVQELSERKKQMEALKAKQDIVDASDAGVLGLQVQKRLYDISEGLKATYPDNPQAAIDAFPGIARPEVEVLKKQAPNDRVALVATKDAESAVSSTLGRLQTWGAARDTQRVKGNIARKENQWVNDASEYTSLATLTNAFSAVDADPDFEVRYGEKAALSERDRVKFDMTASMMGRFSEKEPIVARQLLDDNSKFFHEFMKPAAFKAAHDATFTDMAKRDNEILVQTLLNAGDRGNKLVNLANGGQATASVIFTERKKLALDRQSIIDDKNMSADAKAKKNRILDVYEKSIDAAAQWQKRITPTEYVGDDNVPPEFWVARDKVYATDPPNIEDLLKLDQMIIGMDGDKRISPARAATLRQEVGLDTGKAVASLQDVSWGKRHIWTALRTAKQDGVLEIEHKVLNSKNPLPPRASSDILTDYIQQLNDYQAEKGGLPTGDDNIKMARRAYYRALKVSMPEELR